MKTGPAVSPTVVGVVIVLVVAVLGLVIFRATASRGKVELSGDQIKQMQQMMGQQKADNAKVGQMQAAHSLPPGMPGPK